MFSSQQDGYNKNEVDKYLAKFKADYEALLMEEKLKVLEAERKVLDIKSKFYDIESREKNIMSALDLFNKYQSEGNKNIDALRIEQITIICNEFERVIKKLSLLYGGIDADEDLKKLYRDLKTICSTEKENEDMTSPANTDNDAMRKLLNKMQGYRKKQDNPREVRIGRSEDSKNQIKPVCDLNLEDNDNYDNLVDKYLDTKPEIIPTKSIQNSSGFDLKEAINPKDDLAEIMKAFDFFDCNDDETIE